MSPPSTTIERGSAPGSPAPSSRLATMPAWDWSPHSPQRTLGLEAIKWAEEWLIQPNGPRAGKPFRFTSDQAAFLMWWYAVDDRGNWLFTHGVRRQAKGSGKSPFAAVMALIEFCAPVRLERFDDRVDYGCVGKPVDMPLVQIAATAESQTANTMRMVRAFAPKGSPVVEQYFLDPGKTRYYKLPEGTLEVITSSATAAEGAESSFIVGDETEHWKPGNGGPELAATLEDNLAKSGARMLETANAWVPGTGSVAEDTWDAWVAQEEGRTLGETRILYDARLAPPDTDMSDGESLRSALQWVYGDCDWKKPDPKGPPDVRPIMERIWSPRSRPDESKRKYLNWPTIADDAWCDPADWVQLADRERVVSPTEDVVLFFDGSKSRDATAIVGCCVSDGHIFVPKTIDGRSTVWEPNPNDHDDLVPVADVDLAVDEVFRTHNVVGFFADVKEWESFTMVSWPERHRDDLAVMAVPGGKNPQWIAWDMRTNVFDFTRAAELVEAEILDQGFTHDDNPILARHVANARRRPNKYGVSIGKETGDSPKKIDAAVCMIGARMVRRLAIAAAPQKKRTGVVW
jgi:hypothetical protein